MTDLNQNGFPNIALFCDVYYPTIDGVVRTVHNYARIISASGASVCVVVPKNGNDYSDSFTYDVLRAKSVQLPLKEYHMSVPDITHRLSERLENGGFQLFHAHSPFTMGHYALREARKLEIPLVATFHSKYYDDVLNITHSELTAKAITHSIVDFYEDADSVWAVSEGTAETLRSYGYRGDIFIAENGTDYDYPENPALLRENAVKKFDITTEKPLLLFVGHMIWQKNLRLVLDTAAELKKRGFDFRLIIAGNGYDELPIRSYADRLGLDGKTVSFVGQISDIATMKGLYLAADMFFFPSMYDNSPLVVREAAAMELPSLLLRGSNSAEIIVDGENGYLTGNDASEAAGVIQSVFSSGDKLAAAGSMAKKTICRSWNEVLGAVSEKYRQITADYRPKPKH